MESWTDDDGTWLNDNLPKMVREKASFEKLLNQFGLEYIGAGSGNWQFKLICPFPAHANGSERTPSCYISEDKASFHCFGCNNGGSIIDFVCIYKGLPYGKSLQWLAKFAGIVDSDVPDESGVKEKRKPEETVKYWVMKTGVLMRKYLEGQKNDKKYTKLCKKFDKLFNRLDTIYGKCKDEDFAVAKEFHDKVAAGLEKE